MEEHQTPFPDMLVTCCVPMENTQEPKAQKCSEPKFTNKSSPLSYKTLAENWAMQPTPAGRAITSVRLFNQTRRQAFLPSPLGKTAAKEDESSRVTLSGFRSGFLCRGRQSSPC